MINTQALGRAMKQQIKVRLVDAKEEKQTPSSNGSGVVVKVVQSVERKLERVVKWLGGTAPGLSELLASFLRKRWTWAPEYRAPGRGRWWHCSPSAGIWHPSRDGIAAEMDSSLTKWLHGELVDRIEAVMDKILSRNPPKAIADAVQNRLLQFVHDGIALWHRLEDEPAFAAKVVSELQSRLTEKSFHASKDDCVNVFATLDPPSVWRVLPQLTQLQPAKDEASLKITLAAPRMPVKEDGQRVSDWLGRGGDVGGAATSAAQVARNMLGHALFCGRVPGEQPRIIQLSGAASEGLTVKLLEVFGAYAWHTSKASSTPSSALLRGKRLLLLQLKEMCKAKTIRTLKRACTGNIQPVIVVSSPDRSPLVVAPQQVLYVDLTTAGGDFDADTCDVGAMDLEVQRSRRQQYHLWWCACDLQMMPSRR